MKKDTDINPYLAARNEWNERYGSYIAAAQGYKIISIFALLVSLTSVAGIFYIGSQNKMVPYVVEVDKLGNTLAIGAVEQASFADKRVMMAKFSRFIESFRSVYVDVNAQKKAINEVYSMLSRSDPAFNTISDHYRENTPFKRAEKYTVTTELKSIMPISEKTWQIEWIEKPKSRKGLPMEQQRFIASITYAITPPTTQKDIIKNPIGLYVVDIAWSEQFTQ